MVYIGIDVGVTGAIASIDVRGTVSIFDIPVNVQATQAMVKRTVDPRGVMSILRTIVGADEVALVMMERIHTMPGSRNSPQSGGSLMHSLGVIEAVLAIARMPCVKVSPAKWKRDMGLMGAGKDASRELAIALYPSAAHELRLKKHHNRADALLLAEYARRAGR
jgi:crossover junction endodeoxyribonuclease RuvC